MVEDKKSRLEKMFKFRDADVVTIASDTSLVSAARRLATLKIMDVATLAVCDETSTLLGVISERDLVRAVADRAPRLLEMTVEEIYTRNPVTCTSDDDPADIIKAMNKGGFRHMPVVDDGKLRTIVSRRELIAFLASRTEFI